MIHISVSVVLCSLCSILVFVFAAKLWKYEMRSESSFIQLFEEMTSSMIASQQEIHHKEPLTVFLSAVDWMSHGCRSITFPHQRSTTDYDLNIIYTTREVLVFTRGMLGMFFKGIPTTSAQISAFQHSRLEVKGYKKASFFIIKVKQFI